MALQLLVNCPFAVHKSGNFYTCTHRTLRSFSHIQVKDATHPARLHLGSAIVSSLENLARMAKPGASGIIPSTDVVEQMEGSVQSDPPQHPEQRNWEPRQWMRQQG